VLREVFEGDCEGQRRAVLLFWLMITPVSLAVTAFLSTEYSVGINAFRVAAVISVAVWLALRPVFVRLEWVALIVLAALTNGAGQVSLGPGHSVVLALNSFGFFALACIVLDTGLVAFTGALVLATYTGVQLLFYPIGDAMAAVLMYGTVLVVIGLVVHGTALYLREALHRTQLLNVEIGRTAEQERARIASELHDDTIQVLTAAGLRLDDIARRLDAEGESATAAGVYGVRELIGGSIERTRRLTFELYPPNLDHEGLATTLAALGRGVAEEQGTLEVEVVVDVEDLPRPIEQLAYRTVKELLTNARKHANAKQVTVAVTVDGDALYGVVKDDGCGIGEGALAKARWGFHLGLETTADRLRQAGGALEITSEPDRGTRAAFTVPLPARA
jgi:signal transduction histidine kinase